MVINTGALLIGFLAVAFALVAVAWFVAMKARADADIAAGVVVELVKELQQTSAVAHEWQVYAKALEDGER